MLRKFLNWYFHPDIMGSSKYVELFYIRIWMPLLIIIDATAIGLNIFSIISNSIYIIIIIMGLTPLEDATLSPLETFTVLNSESSTVQVSNGLITPEGNPVRNLDFI